MKNEMKALIAFKPEHNGKTMDFPLAATLPTEISMLTTNTRGIWKVLSMVYYLRNQYTNPIMYGIILESYLSSFFFDIACIS